MRDRALLPSPVRESCEAASRQRFWKQCRRMCLRILPEKRLRLPEMQQVAFRRCGAGAVFGAEAGIGTRCLSIYGI